jgi:hypothetical protein
MFFELREYHALPGKRDELVKVMQDEIIPYQISKGMVVIGSFTVEQDEETYIWIRRFASEEERERLYTDVYQTEYWQKEMSPRMGELHDRSKMKVTRLVATEKSVIQ